MELQPVIVLKQEIRREYLDKCCFLCCLQFEQLGGNRCFRTQVWGLHGNQAESLRPNFPFL